MVLKNSGRWEVCIKTDGRWEVGLKTGERWEVGLKNRWEVGGWPKQIGGRRDFEVRCAKDSNIITQLSMWVHCLCISESMIMRLFFVSFGFLRRVAFCACHN